MCITFNYYKTVFAMTTPLRSECALLQLKWIQGSSRKLPERAELVPQPTNMRSQPGTKERLTCHKALRVGNIGRMSP